MENTVLCGANSYKEKYYFNPAFAALPEDIKKELQIMCVTYTEEAGGIITMEFGPEGDLQFKTMVDDGDIYFDEIESGIIISRMQKEKSELFQQLELFYKVFVLKEELQTPEN